MAGRRQASDRARSLSVTWVRSTIGHTAAARGTIRALGLRRLNQTVQVADTVENRGMLRRVAFLLDVDGLEGGTQAGSGKEETK